MKITMTKYCIVADNKFVEVGCARNYDFIPLDDLEKSKSKINLFHSFKKAKSSFEQSWGCIKWDEDKKCFVSTINNRFKKYEIRELKITYELNV